MGTGFYGSNDPTNSVKALKEQKEVNSACTREQHVVFISTMYRICKGWTKNLQLSDKWNVDLFVWHMALINHVLTSLVNIKCKGSNRTVWLIFSFRSVHKSRLINFQYIFTLSEHDYLVLWQLHNIKCIMHVSSLTCLSLYEKVRHF